ncbi:FCD domain-containing protein [Saccharopolyspora karakumensis]|uniref:FCD domain-containing protein n=1 Tax=Saccharopolyspora karakumensis TaxID=2530386 RepID=UPI0014055CE7|nr:FCD domain-containing protein [Saccharopolyspora karakumensis]
MADHAEGHPRRDDRNATPDQIVHLHQLTERMNDAADWADFHKLDETFHLAVAAATGIGAVQQEYAQLLRELYRYYVPYPCSTCASPTGTTSNSSQPSAAATRRRRAMSPSGTWRPCTRTCTSGSHAAKPKQLSSSRIEPNAFSHEVRPQWTLAAVDPQAERAQSFSPAEDRGS